MNEKLQQVQEEALALCAPVFDEMGILKPKGAKKVKAKIVKILKVNLSNRAKK